MWSLPLRLLQRTFGVTQKQQQNERVMHWTKKNWVETAAVILLMSFCWTLLYLKEEHPIILSYSSLTILGCLYLSAIFWGFFKLLKKKLPNVGKKLERASKGTAWSNSALTSLWQCRQPKLCRLFGKRG